MKSKNRDNLHRSRAALCLQEENNRVTNRSRQAMQLSQSPGPRLPHRKTSSPPLDLNAAPPPRPSRDSCETTTPPRFASPPAASKSSCGILKPISQPSDSFLVWSEVVVGSEEKLSVDFIHRVRKISKRRRAEQPARQLNIRGNQLGLSSIVAFSSASST